MTSHLIIYDITCTVFNDITPTISAMASIVSVSSQQLHWCSQTNCMYDITPTLRMPSHALYTTSYPLFMTSHHCSYHITSTSFMTSHTLYILHHTHGNTNIISAIWPTISNTASTVSVSSNPGYHLYHTPPCRTSHTLYVWHPIQYACYHNNCL